MLRLQVDREVIEDLKLAKTLLRGGVSDLAVGWKQDLGSKEEKPSWAYELAFIYLKDLGPGVYDFFFDKQDCIEQWVITDKAIFWEDRIFPKGTGILGVPNYQLENMQAFTGSGMRMFVYGSANDTQYRAYNPVRLPEKPKPRHKDLELLGQVDLETGDIYPVPKEML